MKCTIPEISWHNREPVLSVDIHPLSSEFYRLASGGGDSHVLIWQLNISDNGAVKQEVIADLTRHQKAVNVVRWSPSGQYLASGDDDANIIIWQLKNDNIPLLEGDTGDKEVWITYKVLRGHKEDIYDLCWSTSGLKLFSGSIDNTAILWDLSKGKMEQILSDHKGFVQGVAWDPKDELIGTISTDRICRLFDLSGKHVKARINKGKIPVPSNHFLYNKEVKYFYDDTFKSFFRRLQFSPDGSILVVPSGHMESDDSKRTLESTLVFTIDNLTEPAAILPLSKQCSTCVRFCPILFELRGDGPDSLLKLPYRMIFAVGTDHDVILYDTQQSVPFARFHEIHYTRLTDLTWSHDGLLLIASSTDGFCALITFEREELGTPYVEEEIMCDNTLNISGIEELDKDENIDITNKDIKIKEPEKKKPTFLERWAANTPPKKMKMDELTRSSRMDIIEIVDDNDTEKELEIKNTINRLFPRKSETSNSKDEKKIGMSLIEQPAENEPPKKAKINKELTKRSATTDNVQIVDKKLEVKNAINRLFPRKSEANKIKQKEDSTDIVDNDNTAKKLKVKNTINRLYPRKSQVSNVDNTKITAIKRQPEHIPPKKPKVNEELAKGSESTDNMEIINNDMKILEGKITINRLFPRKSQACNIKQDGKRNVKSIEKWAENTPHKKAKNPTELNKKTNTTPEVIEILDDDDNTEKISEVKNTIHRLYARKSEACDIKQPDNRIAKPIEVRRKPKNTDDKIDSNQHC